MLRTKRRRKSGLEVYAGGHVAHTGQLFFPEDISRFVEATHPYSGSKVGGLVWKRTWCLRAEWGWVGREVDTGYVDAASDGYVATLTVAVDPGATPKLVGFGGRAALGGGLVGGWRPFGPVGREERRGELASIEAWVGGLDFFERWVGIPPGCFLKSVQGVREIVGYGLPEMGVNKLFE